MNINSINFDRLIGWILPEEITTPFNLNWLKALTSPVYVLYGEFIRYRKDVNYRISLTSQVCSLEGAVNDAIDKDLRRCRIEETEGGLVMLIHLDEAQNPLKTYIEGTGHDLQIPIIHDDNAYYGSAYEFNVIIPFPISVSQEFRVKSILNTYKLPSKRYKIIYT